MGARDLSIINTPHLTDSPYKLKFTPSMKIFIRDAIYFETERGGQVFFIHNRVQNIAEMAAMIGGLCPDLNIGVAHGQLEGFELEQKILDFIDRKYDVLVCTNIVESGVDIANVNTIVVNNAHHFGLSDLHQLRDALAEVIRKRFVIYLHLRSPLYQLIQENDFKRLSNFRISVRDSRSRCATWISGGRKPAWR
jgi:transcription-repair coupling factor (superfamily II helicase)